MASPRTIAVLFQIARASRETIELEDGPERERLEEFIHERLRDLDASATGWMREAGPPGELTHRKRKGARSPEAIERRRSKQAAKWAAREGE